MFTVLIILLIVLFLVILSTGIYLNYKETKKVNTLNTAIRIDKMVDEIINKAVIISHYITDNTNLTPVDFEAKKREQASAIVADVMMQHGIKPKDYNLPALIIVALHKNHFLRSNPEKLGE